MRILVGCEESQVITKAFREKGHEAFSCDLKYCTGGHPEWHIQLDLLRFIELNKGRFDMLIAHPPCTYLSYAGTAHWNLPGRLEKRLEALKFFGKLYESGIPKICLENPRGCASPVIAKYTQEIQPYYFGDTDMKTTWLWLKGLPKLVWHEKDNLFNVQTSTGKPKPYYTDKKGKKRYFVDSHDGTNKNTQADRSKTFNSIAKAMADQWS